MQNGKIKRRSTKNHSKEIRTKSQLIKEFNNKFRIRLKMYWKQPKKLMKQLRT